MRKRFLVPVALAATLLAPTGAFATVEPTGLVAFTQTHATAERYKCTYVFHPEIKNAYSGVCIFGDEVKYGKWFYLGGRGVSGDVTLYVRMCRPDFSACSTISAGSTNWFTPQSGYVEFDTSSKPTSFGHVYHACATMHTNHIDNFWSYVNVCSDWMT